MTKEITMLKEPNTHEAYMRRCLQLARKGAGHVSPNPMVGAVVVHQGKIIGEGYHRAYGGPHAEVHAIASVKDPSHLPESTIYVTLEPCSHWGKTPPCAQLILDKGIGHVVIGTLDPFVQVQGRGVKMLQEAGVRVEVGILESECLALNKNFFYFQHHQRPYVYLKWAESADAFMDCLRTDATLPPVRISSPLSAVEVHRQRSQVDAILVGYRTALLDNPQLNVRHWAGRNPLRVVIDPAGALPLTLSLFDGNAKTVVFTHAPNHYEGCVHVIPVAFDPDLDLVPQILDYLATHKVQSLMVEGGSQTLQAFIEGGFWQEARIEKGPVLIGQGVTSPQIQGIVVTRQILDNRSITGLKKEV